MKFPVSVPLMIFLGLSNSVSSAPAYLEVSEAQAKKTVSAENFSCHNHVSTGIPSEADQYLCRDNYAVGFDYDTKDPKWESYYVTADQLNHIVERDDEFKEDEDIPEQYRATLNDYHLSGYDRGHIAPARTIDTDQEAMAQAGRSHLTNTNPVAYSKS